MKKFFILLLTVASMGACSQNTHTAAYTNLDNKSFAEKMRDSNVVVLDVRTPEEYKAGHIPNARPINFYDENFSARLDSLDKNKTYLVYCAAGGRSSKASAMLIEKNVKSVYNLRQGFNQWDGKIEK